MAQSPRTPKNTIKVRRSIEVGDQLMIPVTVIGKRPMKAAGSAVEREMVSIRIPGSDTPVTVQRDYLLGEED